MRCNKNEKSTKIYIDINSNSGNYEYFVCGICRVEALAILDRMLPEKKAVREAIAFSDVPEWAKASIDNLSTAGIVEGYDDETLGAYDDLTVEQIAILISKLNEYNY